MHVVAPAVRVAVHALIELARRPPRPPVPLWWIAQCTGVSDSYLEQVFAVLRDARIVCAVRGPGGGYVLAREAASIDLAQVAQAMAAHPCGAPVRADRGLQAEGPGRIDTGLWSACADFALQCLAQHTLAELIPAESPRDAPARTSVRRTGATSAAATRTPGDHQRVHPSALDARPRSARRLPANSVFDYAREMARA